MMAGGYPRAGLGRAAPIDATPMMAKRKRHERGAGAPRRAPVGPPGAAAPFLVGRLDAAALAAAVLGPLALYAATLPRTVVLEDDGLFLMAGVHLGVAHPPGYPLYTLIVHLFTRLPFGDAAFLGHLSSAVLGALACGAVYCCARLLRASPAPALTAAWLFGVSEQFWSQAIIAEVYTLNALLFFATYALVLLGARDPGRGWPLWAAAVAWGAGLANHWPLMVLATPGLALALLPVWRDVLPRLPRLLGTALVTAALPYAWMVWRSHQAPIVSFYGSIDTWSDLWFYVSRQGYSGVDVSPAAGWSDRGSFMGWFAADLVRQTTLPGSALALLGLGALARGGGRAAGAAAAGSGLLALLGNSLVLILLLGFDFDPFWLAVFRPYPLVCYGVAALWAAAGMQWLMDGLPGRAATRRPAWAAWAAGLRRLMDRLPGGPAARRAAGAARVLRAPEGARGPAAEPALPGAARGLAALAALAGAALVAVSASGSWPANDRSGSDFAERHAEVVFDLLPQGAVLFVHGDDRSGSDFAERHAEVVFDLLPQGAVLFVHGDTTGPFGYYHYVEERRPDVTLYNLQGLVFGNRLYDPLLPQEERASALERFVASTGRPAFLLPDFDIYPADRGVGHHGFVLEVLGEGTSGTVDLTRDQRGERYFLELLDARPVDRWERSRRSGLLSRYGNYLGLVVLSGSPLLLEPMAELFERAQDCYPCLLGMAAALLDNAAADHAGRIAAWLARAEALHDQTLSKGESAKLPFEQGRLAELTGEAVTAAARYRQAYAIYPHPRIDAGAALHRLGLAP